MYVYIYYVYSLLDTQLNRFIVHTLKHTHTSNIHVYVLGLHQIAFSLSYSYN